MGPFLDEFSNFVSKLNLFGRNVGDGIGGLLDGGLGDRSTSLLSVELDLVGLIGEMGRLIGDEAISERFLVVRDLVL